jgi:hypothetical protein
MDLACNGWANYTLVLRNTGGASFAAPQYIETESAFGLAVADFDADARPDLLAGGRGVYLNRGNGTFEVGGYVAAQAPMAVADFDADGSPDIFGRTGTFQSAIVLNDGHGAFSGPILYDAAPRTSVGVGDFDASGSLDVAFVGARSYVTQQRLIVLSNRGDGTFEAVVDRDADVGPPSDVLDWDCDGVADVITPSVLFRNLAAVPSPVWLQALQATSEPDGVHLRWRLSHAARAALRAVGVQRAEDENGPYGELTVPALAPELEMTHVDDGAQPGRLYWYRLWLEPASGAAMLSAPIPILHGGRTATGFRSLRRNGDGIEIRFGISRASTTALQVFDVRGRLVRVLVDGPMQPGEYLQTWNEDTSSGRAAARGVYFLRLRADGQASARKLVLGPR